MIKIMPEYKNSISIGIHNIFENILTEYDDILNIKILAVDELISVSYNVSIISLLV